MSEENATEEEEEFYEHHRIVVDKGQNLLRIDKFLMDRLMNASRNRIQVAAKSGSVLVNGNAVKPNYKVKPLDVITIVFPDPPRDKEVYPEKMDLDIVYEDEDVFLINKPPGLVVHPGFNNYTGTLVHGLKYHFENLPGDESRPGLVHRIDKDTSGLLLISKNEESMTFLAKQFFDHSITRKYYALVWGDLEEDKGTITGNLARDLRDRKVMRVYEDEDIGKHAITHYEVVERFHYVTLVTCELETGRTHQIRAHFKHIGHPLFNDAMYDGDSIHKGPDFNKYKQFVSNCFELLPRQALHAFSLGFVHPKTKKEMYFEKEIPEDMQAAIDKWRAFAPQIQKW